MLISYAKEAEVFFEDEVPFTTTKIITEDFAKKNSLYTWYVTYVDVPGIEDMDFILFVNGQTGFPLVIPDNAILNWSGSFTLSFMQTLEILGVKDEDVQNYLETFPEFVTVKGILPMMGNYFSQYAAYLRQEGFANDFLEDDDKEFEDLSIELAEILMPEKDKSAAVLMKEVFNHPLPPLRPVSRLELYKDENQIDLKDDLDFRKTYRTFLSLEKDLSKEEKENLQKEYVLITNKVLGAFEDYLKNDLKHRDEIVQRDVSNISRFLREQLREDGKMESPIFSMDELFAAHVYLKSKESLTEEKIKGLTNSLRHFYKFLLEKNAITKKEFDEAKEIILRGEKLVYAAIQYDSYLQ